MAAGVWKRMIQFVIDDKHCPSFCSGIAKEKKTRSERKNRLPRENSIFALICLRPLVHFSPTIFCPTRQICFNTVSGRLTTECLLKPKKIKFSTQKIKVNTTNLFVLFFYRYPIFSMKFLAAEKVILRKKRPRACL